MEDNISPSPSNTKNKNITLEDIKLFYKDRFIDFTRLPSNRYDNITSINLTDNIKYIGKIDSNDIWLETQNNIFLCGVPFSPTRSWYKIKEINQVFPMSIQCQCHSKTSGYSGSLKADIVIQTRCSTTPLENNPSRSISTSVITESGFHTSAKTTLNE
jgi:hypothetical protein